MSHFEQIQNSAKNTKETVDHQWYDRFRKYGSFYGSTYLTVDASINKEQKEKFIKGEIDHPEPHYPKLNLDELNTREKELLELKDDIFHNEENDVVKKAYQWKINEKVATIRMLKCALAGDDKKFFRYSKFIYGMPEKNIHNYTLWQLHGQMSDILQDASISSTQKEAANAILSLTQGNEGTTIDAFEKIEPIHYISTQESFVAEDIQQAFSDALLQKGFDDWRVLIGEKTSVITTSQEKKTITIPKKRTVDYIKLRGLIEHEITTHVQRRENGERSRLLLLGVGLDRYGAGEEGLATYKEDLITGADDYAGFAGHFSASLTCGVDGQKRGFKDVFDILKNYYIAIGKNESDANDAAYKLSVKTFRGTTFHTPGTCFTSNIEYREGNIGVHALVNKNDPEQARFLIGKYNPVNPRHIWILDQLGITDKDLADLEDQK